MEPERLPEGDPLTDLPGSDFFAAELERHLAWSKLTGAQGVLLAVTIDGLPTIAERHGARAKDAAIVAIAKLLRSLVRPGDLVARVADDEFSVLLRRDAVKEAIALAGTLLNAVHAGPVRTPNAVDISIGIAPANARRNDERGPREQAESTMLAAKRSRGTRPRPAARELESPRSGLRLLADPPPLASRADREAAAPRIDVDAVIASVAELGGASLGRVAWELFVPERAVTPGWSEALQARLLKQMRYDPANREWLFGLTPNGRARLSTIARAPRERQVAYATA
jgi:diguanylate cyclase (GGDEF)-like protein